ncbi:DUF445 family protein [uncultured Brachyspira sp.]|uniref:DUF445 family protein n=1 Tax=uncultured Brachyspira sp. TaxID=221953 RepID=UPI0026143F96|nr:DUF445 family protein [uncultured Brachyspira sp.]
MDLFLQLLFGAFLGAVSGYYTNTIALKKLFSNNGIIAREKDKFIDEISKMISVKIINYDSIFKEIKKDKFKNNIKEFFKNVKDKLISKTDIKIKNIVGFNKTKDNIVNWTKENTKDSVILILNDILKNVKVKQIIDDRQVKYIINNVIDSFVSYDRKNNFINTTLKKIADDEKYKIILKEIIDNIFNNLSNKSNESDYEKLIRSLIEYSNIQNCFYNFLSSLSSKRINDLFTVDDISEIKDIINQLSRNKDFENIIDYVIDELYLKLKDTDKTIYELLNPNIANRLNLVLSDILPKLIDIIIPIINENKLRLDTIIEEAVDEEIENIDGIFWQFIVKLIRKVFLQDIAARYKIVQKIIEYVEKYKENSDDIIKAITNDIVNYLNDTKISVILKNVNNIDNVKNIVKDIVLFNIREIPDSWIEKFLNMRIDVLVDSNMIKDLYTFLEKEIIKYISSNSIIEKIKSVINKKIDSLNADTLKLILDNEKIISIINQNRSNIENYIFDIYNQYKDRNINSLFEDIDYIFELLFELFENIINKYSDKNLNEFIINKENQINYFIDNNAYNSILSFLSKEKIFISNIIDSLVIKTIKNNMGKLNKDEIARIANDFMGKELEPINMLGALLGLVFGLFTAYLFPTNSFNLSLGYLNYIAEPLVYTFIGWITNVLAIYSIFQPYEPLFGIKKKVFWGAVACEKNRFAASMSDFVNDRLMEKEGILDILDNKKDIENNLIKDNYKTFFNYMLEDEKIVSFNIFSSLKNNLNSIIKGSINSIKSGAVQFVIKNNYLDKIKENKNIKKSIIDYTNSNIDNILISILNSLLKNIDVVPLKEFIQNIVRNNLNDLSRFKNIIVTNMIKALNSNSVRDRIFIIVTDLLDNEISKNGDKKIKEMFGGEILNLVKSNNEFIFSMMNKKLNETLNNNRYEIRDMILENVPLRNDFVVDLVDRIILNLINRKIPVFINDMKYNIMNISFNFLDDNILSKKVAYLFGDEKLYEVNSLRKYLDDTIDNNQKMILNVSNMLFEVLVNNLDNKITEKYINLFLKNTDNEFYDLIKRLCINIYNNRDNVITSIRNYIENRLYPISIKDCINIEKYFDDVFNDIFKYSKNGIEEFLIHISNDDNLIDLDNLKESLYKLLETLENDELINNTIYIESKKILLNLRNDLLDIIDDETKYYFLNLIIDCAKDDINLIIEAIDFSKITREEIDNMNPKNIHDVFNSFAKKYLNRLKLYGMFGGLVGVLLVIIKCVNTVNADVFNVLNIIVIVLTGILSIFMIINIIKNI